MPVEFAINPAPMRPPHAVWSAARVAVHRAALAWFSVLAAGAGSALFGQGAVNSGARSSSQAARKPPVSLASLPPVQAGGAPRILLVDDDASSNNGGSSREPSASDTIFRQLAANAVGQKAENTAVEVVKSNSPGPAIERLREYNVILWYTGGSYGGGTDTLGRDDEATLRRYLEEVGGAVIIVSPGYVNNLVYGQNWESADHPFLKEVLAVNGCYGLAQRFSAGTVQSTGGTSFTVAHPGAAQTIFSVVNPDGAAIVFTSPIRTDYVRAEGALPVAVANAFGRGRIVYVGFTFENIPEPERSAAFTFLLSAATGGPTVATTPTRVPVADRPQTAVLKAPPAAPPGPPPTNLEIRSSGAVSHTVRWLSSLNEIDGFDVYRRDPSGWKLVAPKVRNYFHTDTALLAPNSAYKVVALYRDGRRGEAVVEYPNPPGPGRPSDLRASQAGAGKVTLNWTVHPTAHRYRVTGPGIAPAGYVVDTFVQGQTNTTGTLTVVNVPIGIQEFRVTAEYTGDLVVQPSPVAVKVAVNSDRGRYRVVFRGFKLNGAVPDDIIDADGRGNEIFAGAMIAAADPSTGDATRVGLVETLVYGDTQNFPARIRAGSAGPTGGLRVGDIVPATDAALTQPGLTGQNDRFPLQVWEGELVDGGPLVAIVPFLIEWNATDHSTLSHWYDFWKTGSNTLGELATAMRQAARRPATEAYGSQPMYGMHEEVDRTRAANEAKELVPHVPGFTPAADRDRIIGLTHTSIPRAFYLPRYGHKATGLLLTRPLIERALAGQPSMMVTHGAGDIDSPAGVQAYFQIERLTPPPLSLPAEAPPLIAVTTNVPPTVTTGVIAAPPASSGPVAIKAPVGTNPIQTAELKPPPAPPAGPAPTNIAVLSGPGRQTITWISRQGSKCTVYRKQGDGWITVVTDTTFDRAYDDAWVPPNTVYRVEARFPDGAVGAAEFTLATPFIPKPATELSVTQVGNGRLKVSWKPPTGYGGTFRIFCPGLPPEGLLATDAKYTAADGKFTTEVANIPPGTHVVRVVAQYDVALAPVDARTYAEVKAWSGQYRLVLLGFRVGRKTVDDDILDGDGRGDEVFFGAYRLGVPDLGGSMTLVPLGVVQTPVMGDTDRFPARVRLGGASPTGGVRSGDVLPSAAALQAQPRVVAHSDRLPLLLWEGTLTSNNDAVAVGTVGFEWDNGDLTAWNRWVGWWDSPAAISGTRMQSQATLRASPDAIRYVPLVNTYEVSPEKPLIEDRLAIPPPPGTPREQRYSAFRIDGRPIGNRPLGALKREGGWFCVPHGFVLSRQNVEKTLRSQAAAVLEAPLRTHRGPGASRPEEEDESEYTIIVQVERLTGTPLYP